MMCIPYIGFWFNFPTYILFSFPCLDFIHCQEIVDRNKENHALGNIVLIFSLWFNHLEEHFFLHHKPQK